MGTEVCIASFRGRLTRAEAKKKLQSLIEEAEERSGHQDGYSGDWNSASTEIDVLLAETFPNKQAAIDSLVSNVSKWGCGIAFFKHHDQASQKSLNKSDLKRIESIKKIVSSLQIELDKNAKIRLQLISDIKTDLAESTLRIKCKQCESSFGKRFLKNKISFSDDLNNTTTVCCPVCSEQIIEPVHKYIKRIDKLSQDNQEIRNDLRSLSEEDTLLKQSPEAEIHTVMVGMAAS